MENVSPVSCLLYRIVDSIHLSRQAFRQELAISYQCRIWTPEKINLTFLRITNFRLKTTNLPALHRLYYFFEFCIWVKKEYFFTRFNNFFFLIHFKIFSSQSQEISLWSACLVDFSLVYLEIRAEYFDCSCSLSWEREPQWDTAPTVRGVGGRGPGHSNTTKLSPLFWPRYAECYSKLLRSAVKKVWTLRIPCVTLSSL